ncbi:ubiquitin-protein ligase 7, partial [Genlisea aurea]
INFHNQVSLRGASVKEVTRDALLERVNQEREIRNHNKRVTIAVLLIQRVWRRHHMIKSFALMLRNDWITMMDTRHGDLTGIYISQKILRPFLFFIHYLSMRLGKIDDRDSHCMLKCFSVMLEDIASRGVNQGFCSMAIGNSEERMTWFYQSKKLISVCLFVLSRFDHSRRKVQDAAVTSAAMRLSVLLTDSKGWKCMPNSGGFKDTKTAVENMVRVIGSQRSGMYAYIRKFICKLEAPSSLQAASSFQKDERFLIMTSAVTLSLRPFHLNDTYIYSIGLMASVVEQFCVSLLTIPWFPHRFPAILVPAFSHKSVLSPCLKLLLASSEKILKEMDQLEVTCSYMPPIGWALANIVYLATGSSVNTPDSGKFIEGLDYASYINVVALFADNLLSLLEKTCQITKARGEVEVSDSMEESVFQFGEADGGRFSNLSYLDLMNPVCQQWHLRKLLDFGRDTPRCGHDSHLSDSRNYGVVEISHFYASLLRLYSILNPVLKSLPVLNLLSFTPGFLFRLWAEIENSLFRRSPDSEALDEDVSGKKTKVSSDWRQKRDVDTGKKWVNMLQKITGQSAAEENSLTDSVDGQFDIEEHSCDKLDIDHLRQGAEGLEKDLSCLLLLFCSTYSHLLLVLDDVEFYDKQIPFKLEQQRKIASTMNTLVYNSLSRVISNRNRALLDSAVRCLHLLYERDCRRAFCRPSLWLSPGKGNRIPISVAARACESYAAADSLHSSSLGSIITTMPHVYPFEDRVKMFREFIGIDKVSRRVTAEGAAPGPTRSIEIVVRRGHLLEDGFRQLNSLGSRLKSSIHVSFVSQSGLPEAGLDYGGLSKEFWTDIAKAGFSPEYGLFSQTSTSDRLLIPDIAARFLDNGIQMIEFFGRIVGKALYEGILMDFYFSHVFVQKLLGRYSFLDELSTLDPELYKNIMYVKHYDGDVKDLSLDFTVTEERLGKRCVIELKPGGKDLSVSNENKLQYVHAMADYKLNRQILPFANAFYRGLTDLISPSWLKLFNANEFNQLLSGGDHDIDSDDLKRNTQYTGGYSEGSRTIKLFWEVMVFAGFEPKERCMVLKFVTSCSRAPLLGFRHLHPSFTIHKVVCDVPLWASFGGQDVDRLPSASTCYNTLKLPTYRRASTLRSKLLYAINSNAGFELS